MTFVIFSGKTFHDICCILMWYTMKDLELLDLISRGNTEDLLQQKNLSRRLNTLTANGLIEIYEGKICITPKGRNLQKEKNIFLLENTRLQREMEEFSKRSCERNSFYVYLSLVLLCMTAVFLFILFTRVY